MTSPGRMQAFIKLEQKLNQLLLKQGDPRILGHGDIFESYPYYQKLPEKGFPGFKEYGKYNPDYAIEQKNGKRD